MRAMRAETRRKPDRHWTADDCRGAAQGIQAVFDRAAILNPATGCCPASANETEGVFKIILPLVVSRQAKRSQKNLTGKCCAPFSWNGFRMKDENDMEASTL